MSSDTMQVTLSIPPDIYEPVIFQLSDSSRNAVGNFINDTVFSMDGYKVTSYPETITFAGKDKQPLNTKYIIWSWILNE
jgi:hypothetical protein